MSLLGIAKKAASASAGFVWKSSGAANVPILEGGRKMLGTGVASRFKSEDGVGKEKTKKKKPQVEAAAPESLLPEQNPAKIVDPVMAARMAKVRAAKAAKAAAAGEKPSTVDANKEAQARAEKASKFNRVPAQAAGSDIPDEMVTDIRRIKELNEELLSKIGGGFGGLAGGLAGMLGNGLQGIVGKLAGKLGLGGLVAGLGAGKIGGLLGKMKGFGAGLKDTAAGGTRGILSKGAGLALGVGKSLASKIPGIGGIAEGAKGLIGRVPSILASGAGLASTAAAKGGSILEAGKSLAGKIPGIAKGAGSAVLGAGGGLLAAAKSKGASLMESGKGLINKVAGSSGAAVAPAAAGTAAAGAGKLGLKTIIKNVPILGLLARTGFAVKRAMDGDWTGAGMEVAAGVASTFPGIGTAAALGIDAGLIARDAGAFSGDDEQKKVEAGAQNITASTDKAANSIAKISATGNPDIQRAMMQSDDPVSGGLASLQAFVAAAMDEEKGIYVRPARSPFDDPSLFKREGVQQASFSPSATDRPVINRAPVAAIPQTTGPDRSMKREKGTTAQIATARDAAARGTSAFSQVPTDSFAATPLGNLISRGEGDYDSYNSGTKGVEGGKIGHSGKKNLSEMTLNEIIESSEKKNGNDKDRVFAAGRYQIITPTLKESIKKMGLKGDEKFTPELQDKIFKETLVPKSVNDYLSGKSEDKEKAQVDLAKVWRSFADPRTGKTYADSGASANKASITSAESAKALEETRAQLTGASNKNAVQGAESKTSVALEQAATQAKEVERKKSAAPVIVQASAAPAPSGPSNAGGAKSEALGHMGTRNDDSSIKRLTDAKMSYGMI